MDRYSKLLQRAQEIDLSQPAEFEAPKIKILKKPKELKNPNRPRGIKLRRTKDTSKFLINLLAKRIFINKWKNLMLAEKYQTKGYDEKRANFKKFLGQISDKFFDNRRKLGKEILENLSKLPKKKGIIHDPNFNKIKLVNNDVLINRYEDRIKFWAKLHFILSINVVLGNMIYDAIQLMKKNRGINDDVNDEEVNQVMNNIKNAFS
jgi:hypothetical protein